MNNSSNMVRNLIIALILVIAAGVVGYFIGKGSLVKGSASVYGSTTFNPCDKNPTKPCPPSGGNFANGGTAALVVGDSCFYWPKGGDGWEEGKENAKGGCDPALAGGGTPNKGPISISNSDPRVLAGKGIFNKGPIMIYRSGTTSFYKAGDPCQYSLNGGMDEPKWGIENEKGGCDPKALAGGRIVPKGVITNSATATKSTTTAR